MAAEVPALQAAIIEGLTGTGTKLVIGENTYMYGDTNGKPLTEALPYAATTRKGKVRAAMSEAAMAAHKAGKVRVAIGRGSDFFGPFALDSGLGDRAFLPALQGKAAADGRRSGCAAHLHLHRRLRQGAGRAGRTG